MTHIAGYDSESTYPNIMLILFQGFLPGWWVGGNDNRHTEPYVTPERWTQELISAGFKTPDAIVYDDVAPNHQSANIVVSPATDAIGIRRITLLHHSMKSPGVDEMKALLEDSGISVDHCLFGEILPDSEGVISLLDLEHPTIPGMSEETFKTIVSYFNSLISPMVWVTKSSQIDCHDPRASMILGLARTARNELSVPLVTVEVDKITPLRVVSEKVIDILSRVNSLDRFDDEMDPDWEYAIVNGEVMVPRFHWETVTNSLAQSPSRDSDSAKCLTIGSVGLLHTMQWIQKSLPELKSEEVLVEIKAIGLNFRVS